MKLVKTIESIGQIVAHDMTQIIPGTYKGPRFRRGHVIMAEDIPILLDMGKEQIYIWEKPEGMLHEEEGATQLSNLVQGDNIRPGKVFEGKIELFAECNGLLKVKSDTLYRVNSIEGIAVITRRGNIGVIKDDRVASAKIIPLLIEKEKLREAASICGEERLLSVIPYVPKKIGIIVTGTEVYSGRIPDAAVPTITTKIEALSGVCTETIILDDDHERITSAILAMFDRGIDLIVCSGGMSVDPDDKTPLAIRNTGARIVSYGVPIMPGVMLLLAYIERKGAQPVPIVGLPACVLHDRITAFDVLLPRLMADDPITREELVRHAEGGLDSAALVGRL
ncbi:molybdopterin-binding protein [Spirochaetia bacterium]|nr:molybdopterin-binding protein [Spirochaetia bacterium]GHU35429.1 molybdopterin-binding protein [Spirochaetia bacterium]